MSPSELRAYVLIFTRDVMIPVGGMFLAIYLPLAHQFSYWQLPLIAGMLGVPLVSDSPLLHSDDGEETH